MIFVVVIPLKQFCEDQGGGEEGVRGLRISCDGAGWNRRVLVVT